jgi:hypothetical protein
MSARLCGDHHITPRRRWDDKDHLIIWHFWRSNLPGESAGEMDLRGVIPAPGKLVGLHQHPSHFTYHLVQMQALRVNDLSMYNRSRDGKVRMAKIRATLYVMFDEIELPELQKICLKRGGTQTAILSRLVQWFARQDPSIQTAILAAGTDPARIEAIQNALVRSLAGTTRFVAPAFMADAVTGRGRRAT